MPTTLTAPITVWIVEDDHRYRQTLRFVLSNTSGLQCTQAFFHCEGALKLATAIHDKKAADDVPDVILLDINLPGLSGVDGIAALKTCLPETTIVMLTILDDADIIYEALRNGASGYLLKTDPLDQIIAAVRAAALCGMSMAPDVAHKVLGYFKKTKPQEDYGLTPRETEVLTLMAEGCTQKEIAARFFIEPTTVNTHIRNIYQKLHVHSAPEAVAKAILENLIDLSPARPSPHSTD